MEQNFPRSLQHFATNDGGYIAARTAHCSQLILNWYFTTSKRRSSWILKRTPATHLCLYTMMVRFYKALTNCQSLSNDDVSFFFVKLFKSERFGHNCSFHDHYWQKFGNFTCLPKSYRRNLIIFRQIRTRKVDIQLSNLIVNNLRGRWRFCLRLMHFPCTLATCFMFYL